jgi:hypothetical protein
LRTSDLGLWRCAGASNKGVVLPANVYVIAAADMTASCMDRATCHDAEDGNRRGQR